jgi:diacylglycerol kinase (ATP)
VHRDILLFVNPTAGGGRGARAVEPAASVLRGAGFSVREVVGRGPADALARLRDATTGGDAAVVAVGGDGMVGLALQAVAGTRTPLGVVAVGTGNDFARSVGLPIGDPTACAAVVAQALKEERAKPVDLGRSGDRWFGTILASGFDSRVNDRANRMGWAPGRLRYDLAMVAELGALRPIPFRMTLDDGAEQEIEATLVAVGNGSSYGGGMRICADAKVDDGLFDVVVVGKCSRTKLLRVFPSVYKGTHLDLDIVTVHRAASVRLAAPAITGYADGELLGPLPLTATTVPGAVEVLV